MLLRAPASIGRVNDGERDQSVRVPPDLGRQLVVTGLRVAVGDRAGAGDAGPVDLLGVHQLQERGGRVVPQPAEIMIANAFDNVAVVPRVVNNLLQGKWDGAGREVGRFLINSTVGMGGFFDPAKDVYHITKSPAACHR